MDNQGSNSFNNNQSATPRDANFWNPVPPQGQQSTQLTPSVQTPQSYVSTSTLSAPFHKSVIIIHRAMVNLRPLISLIIPLPLLSLLLYPRPHNHLRLQIILHLPLRLQILPEIF